MIPQQIKGVFTDFFYCRSIYSFVLSGLRGAALLEYPQDLLESLDEYTVNHHFGDWDNIYKSIGHTKPEYDLWLEKYAVILKESRDIPIIDLGCGYGSDTLYLHERGHKVISCDLSMQALKRLNYFIDKPVVRQFDMLAGLPFENGSAKIVIADLSIHYFLWKDTERIVEEIGRVLASGGYLLCRVNAVDDTNYRSEERIAIEDSFYHINGRSKRFFDKGHFEMLFMEWETACVEKCILERFGAQKAIWEIAVRKLPESDAAH